MEWQKHRRVPKLSSIPESEISEERRSDWVPKRKHNALKAKYKCLKKVYQIYDENVISILPNPYVVQSELPSVKLDQPDNYQPSTSKRKKRSKRTITDSCIGTTDQSIGDVSIDKPATTTSSVKNLQVQFSCSAHLCSETSQLNNDNSTDVASASSHCKDDKESRQTEEDKQNIYNNYFNSIAQFLPCYEKRKPNKLQNFLSRLFGYKKEESNHAPKGHIYAASDNNYRRKRNGLRLGKTKNVHSEIAVRNFKTPVLTCVQSIQQQCLMDSVQRQCPVAGCCTMLYGIINYNDHLNFCHHPNNKHFCHYCHEGFKTEYEKIVHENEHLGISKLTYANIIPTPTIPIKKVVITQTEPDRNEIHEEKLKKVVSFFDKIIETEKRWMELKKYRPFSSMHRTHSTTVTLDTGTTVASSSTDKRTVSCGDIVYRKSAISKMTMSTGMTPGTPIKCRNCGEIFDYRRQLSLHMDLEHRAHDKFSKFHSCAGLISYQTKSKIAAIAGDVHIQAIKLHDDSFNSSSTSSDYTESEDINLDRNDTSEISSSTLNEASANSNITKVTTNSNITKVTTNSNITKVTTNSNITKVTTNSNITEVTKVMSNSNVTTVIADSNITKVVTNSNIEVWSNYSSNITNNLPMYEWQPGSRIIRI